MLSRNRREARAAQVALVLDDADASVDPQLRCYQAVRSGLAPGVFMDEGFRTALRARILWEFNRTQPGPGTGSRDGGLGPAEAVEVDTCDGAVLLADVEPISAEKAKAAAAMLSRIAAENTAKRR